MSDTSLAGRVAWVTGGASGMGRAIAPRVTMEDIRISGGAPW